MRAWSWPELPAAATVGGWDRRRLGPSGDEHVYGPADAKWPGPVGAPPGAAQRSRVRALSAARASCCQGGRGGPLSYLGKGRHGPVMPAPDGPGAASSGPLPASPEEPRPASTGNNAHDRRWGRPFFPTTRADLPRRRGALYVSIHS